MVRVLTASLLLLASASHAAPAIPSFEVSAANLQSAVAGMHKSRVKSVGNQIDSLAWDLDRERRDVEQLRSELRWLTQRLRSQQRPGDQSLRWDVQRFSRDLQQVSRDLQWKLNDARMLAAQAQKDETLVKPAERLQAAARWLKDSTNWFAFDARFAYWDFSRAGFTFEAMDLQRDSSDADSNAQNLLDESGRLLAKVKG